MKRLVPLVGLFVCVGCIGPSVEGTWKVTPAEALPIPSTVQVTFVKPDIGTAVIHGDSELPGGMGSVKLEADVTGTWKLDGEKLTWTATDAKLKSSDGKDLPDFIANSAKSLVKENLDKNATGKIKWDGNDKFTVTLDSGKTATFERVKS